MKLDLKKQLNFLLRNGSGFAMIVTSFIMIISVLRINVELDVFLALLLILIVMFNLFAIVSVMYLISISEDIRIIKKIQ